jgi:hypothetical protein
MGDMATRQCRNALERRNPSGFGHLGGSCKIVGGKVCSRRGDCYAVSRPLYLLPLRPWRPGRSGCQRRKRRARGANHRDQLIVSLMRHRTESLQRPSARLGTSHKVLFCAGRRGA